LEQLGHQEELEVLVHQVLLEQLASLVQLELLVRRDLLDLPEQLVLLVVLETLDPGEMLEQLEQPDKLECRAVKVFPVTLVPLDSLEQMVLQEHQVFRELKVVQDHRVQQVKLVRQE
jgi:hypothetical protein